MAGIHWTILLLSSLSTIVVVTSEKTFVPSSSKAVWGVPRGGEDGSVAFATPSYASQCEDVKSSIIADASKQIEALRRSIQDEATPISSFGSKADTICNSALEQFATNAPDAADSSASLIYDKKLDELESALDAPLHVLYLKQLALHRETAISTFRSASKISSSTSDYDAMLSADSAFVQQAEDATREGSDWDYSSERSHLQSIMNDMASTKKKILDVKIDSAEKQKTAMSFLQQQQQMIQQLQMQLYGQSSPWNVGLAYRIPDTNFNVQGTYQQGRTNVQLSCVPDEYAPMLGANGFTNGVGPGNLGLSLNLSV